MKILFQEEIAYMMKNSLDDWMNKYSNVIDKRDIDNLKNTLFSFYLW